MLCIFRARTDSKSKYSLFHFPKDKDFIGVVSDDGFQASPILTYSNSFRPLIIAKITDSGNGSVVSVQMKVIESVSIFMIVWQSLLAVFLLLIGEGVISGQTPLSVGVFVGAAARPFQMPHPAGYAKKWKRRVGARRVLPA